MKFKKVLLFEELQNQEATQTRPSADSNTSSSEVKVGDSKKEAIRDVDNILLNLKKLSASIVEDIEMSEEDSVIEDFANSIFYISSSLLEDNTGNRLFSESVVTEASGDLKVGDTGVDYNDNVVEIIAIGRFAKIAKMFKKETKEDAEDYGIEELMVNTDYYLTKNIESPEGNVGDYYIYPVRYDMANYWGLDPLDESVVNEAKFKKGQYIKAKKDSDNFDGDVYDKTNDVDGSEILKNSSFEIYEIGKDEVILWSDADEVEYSIDPDDLKNFVKESVVTEADGAMKSAIDFMIRAPKARKAQDKVNKLKLKIAGMEASIAASDAEKPVKDKLKAKVDMMKAQSKDLQSSVNDRWDDKGNIVKKAKQSEKIKGELSVLKTAMGEEGSDKGELKKTAANLKARLRDEESALKDMEPNKEEQADAVDQLKKEKEAKEKEAAKDKGTSGKDKGTSGKDEGTSGKDKGTSGKDEGTSGKDKGTSGKDEGTSGKDKGTSGKDEGTSGKDKGTSGKDEGTSGKDKGTSGKDKGTSGKDKGTSGKDKGTSGKDKGTSGKDKGTSGKDKGTSGKDKGTSGINDSVYVNESVAQKFKRLMK